MSQIPLLLLHAATRDRHDFAPFLGRGGLAAFEPITFDLLGHGDAPRRRSYSVAEMAAAIDFPDAPSILYGHSLGGLVSLYAAHRAPGRFSAIVLEDPPLFEARQPRLDTRPDADNFRKLNSIMTRKGKDWTLKEWASAIDQWPSGHGQLTFAQACDEAAIARRARQIMHLDPALLDAIVAADFNADYEVIPAVRQANCPVIIIAGDRAKGSALSVEDLQDLAAEPNVSIVRACGTGHYIREAQPELCLAALNVARAV